MFKVNNRNTRTRCEICSKLTIKTPERRYWHRSSVFNVKFEHCSSISIVNFEQANTGWVRGSEALKTGNYLPRNQPWWL